MKVLNFGSLNIDYVYTADHLVTAGETLAAEDMMIFAGGKGLNQSVAISKTGLKVYHAGLVGNDSEILLDTCRKSGVDTTYIHEVPGKGGHTIIQVDKKGQNAILLYGGSNRKLTKPFIDEVLSNFSEGDILLLQNEVNLLDYIIEKAYEIKMKIILNPSPFDSGIDACDLAKVNTFLVNEIEGKQISGANEPDKILDYMMYKYPESKVILTLGEEGAYYCDKGKRFRQDIFPAKVVDTTAAGDTFTGYFIYGLVNGLPIEKAMEVCAKAASIAVSRKGAAASIPNLSEVLQG